MIDKPLGQDEHVGMLVTWDHEMIRVEHSLRTSLPYETEDDKLGVLAIFESETVKGELMVGKEFDVSDWIAGPSFVTNKQDGSLQPCVRTLLLGPNQPPIAFMSFWIRASIKKIADCVGHFPPWDPPVKVRLVRAGRTYKLIPVAAAKSEQES